MAEPAFRSRLPSRGEGRQWPAQGEWTYDDYARLPDDGNRYEVIRGVLYVTPAPNYRHQFVIMNLAASFHEFLAERELGVVLPAPFDILLPREIASPVEPDLVVFRSGNIPDWGAKNFAGVPDLVVEVLSPSTRGRDRRIKLRAYEEAGVPGGWEYWLVDPDLRFDPRLWPRGPRGERRLRRAVPGWGGRAGGLERAPRLRARGRSALPAAVGSPLPETPPCARLSPARGWGPGFCRPRGYFRPLDNSPPPTYHVGPLRREGGCRLPYRRVSQSSRANFPSPS